MQATYDVDRTILIENHKNFFACGPRSVSTKAECKSHATRLLYQIVRHLPLTESVANVYEHQHDAKHPFLGQQNQAIRSQLNLPVVVPDPLYYANPFLTDDLFLSIRNAPQLFIRI